MRFIYSAEHLDFIRDGYKQMGIPELTASVNLAFGLDKTQQQIKAVIKNNRFTCGRKQGRLTKGRYRSYTPEQAEFIKQGYQKWALGELTKQFNANFDANKTESQIRVLLVIMALSLEGLVILKKGKPAGVRAPRA